MRRETLDDNLADLQTLLDEMGPHVDAAFRKASAALVEGRVRMAEQVVENDHVIDDLRSRIEKLAVETMSIHQPVVGPLREVVSALRCSHVLERMGDLAEHVARVVVRRAPAPALPQAARPVFRDYGVLVAAMGDKAMTVLRTRNVVLATELATDDEAVDAMHRHVFEVLFGDDWTDGVPAAVDAALLARFHERYADQAVDLVRHVVYAVTGSEPDSLPL
ncbi:phosphate signaling complex protein PhoU [Pseudonocardia endophytica]|uniref:PhoU-like phosphate uptake regulator n=1 Tax=Pseudonocardia endophytica TaxID=401976 RepID=A0A4R1HZP7_PSEEN|nr:phosphate signaling complex protein PhoU [Pseudonocardia endophytica]TCK27051.1 PhoU-like phosphate uptake regulator [Pseudonocardia endophytica]